MVRMKKKRRGKNKEMEGGGKANILLHGGYL